MWLKAGDYNPLIAMSTALRATLLCALALGRSLPALGQTLPSEPLALADGHVTIGGDLSATVGPDDQGFFNYTDYDHSTLRLFRVDLTAALKVNAHFSVLGEVRTENIGPLRAYAFYLRIRPWTRRAIDIQAGRVPPTFGAFARRVYASDNILIGYPLAYQYLTSLRADALPLNANELLSMRGRGWLSSYSIGNQTPANGLALASGFRWDTGVQLHGASDLVDATVSVTTGTISNPLFTDDNSGRQLAGRLSVHPLPGLILGASAARGPFVSATAARSAVGDGHDREFTQTAWGGDVEYSRDYYLVRAETVFSRWKVPEVGAPVIDAPLGALATYVEGRYKIQPGLYAAARVDHLGFSELTGSTGRETWDAPVTRVEIGGGYSIQRNLLLKLSFQHNRRDGGRISSLNLWAAQLVYWF
jgi:hypothetical protein